MLLLDFGLYDWWVAGHLLWNCPYCYEVTLCRLSNNVNLKKLYTCRFQQKDQTVMWMQVVPKALAYMWPHPLPDGGRVRLHVGYKGISKLISTEWLTP